MDPLQSYQKFKQSVPFCPGQSIFAQRDEMQNQNSDYTAYTFASVDCYLCFDAFKCERCLYCFDAIFCRDCIDCDHCIECESCYQCANACFRCSNSTYLDNCAFCYNVHFSEDCFQMNNCFGCVRLAHKQYYIFNQPYEKEAYFAEVARLKKLPVAELKERVAALAKSIPRDPMTESDNQNCTYIDNTFHSVNSHYCFDSAYLENTLYAFDSAYLKNCTDVTYTNYSEHCYNTVDCNYSVRCYACKDIENCSNSAYLENCMDCEDCFGCVGLRGKKNYIFNKPYTVEEYQKYLGPLRQAFGTALAPHV